MARIWTITKFNTFYFAPTCTQKSSLRYLGFVHITTLYRQSREMFSQWTEVQGLDIAHAMKIRKQGFSRVTPSIPHD